MTLAKFNIMRVMNKIYFYKSSKTHPKVDIVVLLKLTFSLNRLLGVPL